MIQLTKGTNVLDINLSDFSGAGQDVVQNGSFNDIGSDLVQNGDFAEIGSELITNGDFSATPLGSEIVVNPNFVTDDISAWNIAGTPSRATKSWNASQFMRLTYDVAAGQALYDNLGHTLNAYYNVKMRVRGTKADGSTAQGSLFHSIGDLANIGVVISNPTLTSEWQDYEFNVWSTEVTFRFYLASAEIGDLVDFDSISVKENTNLVTNPNFTDTGSELVTNGDFATDSDWAKGTGITISGGSANFTGSPNANINQNVGLVTGKSYKIVFTISNYVSGDIDYNVGGNTRQGNIAADGTYTDYVVSDSGNFLYFQSDQTVGFVGSIDSISVKELGEDWVPQPTDPNSTSFDENGLTLVQSSDLGDNSRVYQLNVTEADKSYKVTYVIHSVSLTSGNSVQYYDGDSYENLPEQGVGTHTFYYTREGTNNNWIFNLRAPTDSPTDFVTISSLVVQELGEDWAMNETGSVAYNENGATITSINGGADEYKLYQDDVTTSGKSYKVVYTIYANGITGTNRLRYYDGASYVIADSSVGTHTLYFNRVPTVDRWYWNLTTDAGTPVTDFITISSTSIKEVGQDWTVQEPSGQSVTFPNSTLSIVYDSTETQGSTGVYQDILTIGKYYKIEIDVASITGDLKLQVGSDSQVINTTGTSYFYTKSDSARIYIVRAQNGDSVSGVVNSISIKQLDTNGRWVTFADPDSKSVMKLGQVDLEIDSSGNNCGVYQTGLIKPNKLYIITINMKATAAINVEIAASLGTAVSAVIGTETLTTSYKEYSFEYVTPFAVDHDLQIHRLFGSGANQTISIDYVSMNGVDESQWTNDPTWNPFATSLVFVPTLTDESTNNSKQFTLDTSITDGGWDGRSLHGQVIINEFPTEVPASGIINLKQPDFLEGFYQVEIRGYLGTFYRVLGKCMAHLERTSTEDGYNRFESYNDTVTYKAYEE